MKTWLIDTETCGLHGVPVLLQYATDDGPVILHHLWLEPIFESMAVIEQIVYGRVVAHNLRFDWFMLSKFYNMLRWLTDRGFVHSDSRPVEIPVDTMAEAEWQSQFGLCLKPAAAVDTLLLAAKSEDQSFLMDAKAMRVRRIPFGMADALCAELNKATVLPWILFAGKKDREQRWTVTDNTDRRTGEVDPYWRDLKISFAPSKGLKDLAVFLCDHKQPAKFADIAYEVYPAEEGFAPFAKLLSSKEKDWLYPIRKKNSKGEYTESLVETWPAIIKDHVDHWYTNEDAQAYAEDDIHMLRKLYDYFGSLEEDEDSLVACQVASVRLRGFAVDIEGAARLKKDSQAIVDTAELNVNSPKQVAGYVAAALDPMEQFILTNGCDQKVIDAIKIEFTLEDKEECYCDGGRLTENSGGDTGTTCPRCGGVGTVGPGPMPVVDRVEHVESVRRHTKRIELFNKLLLAKRAYPDFNVIGTKSGRMSGAGGLNFQGIDHSDDVRSLFVLADPGLVLSAGDYSGQELAIAATAMKDDDLMHDMQSGRKLHGIFASQVYETTYEDIMANQNDGRYTKGKIGVFTILFGGTFETLAKNMGIEVEIAEAAYNRMVTKYPQMGNTRKKVTERFSSMKQTDEGKIEYRDPPEKFIESVFGFRRYFQTEYEIQRMILSVIKNPPFNLKEAGKVAKTDRDGNWKSRGEQCVLVERTEGKRQTLWGACTSALYGAAFSIQNQVIRSGNNHVIQSTGRHLTIGMQAAIWSIQPQGIHPFKLTLMSIHDELAVVSLPEVVPTIQDVLEEKINEQCRFIPLTSIEWFTGNKSWAEKGSGEEGKVFGWQL